LGKLELLLDGALSTLRWVAQKTGQPDLVSNCPGGKPESV